jgi:hypothetical protein
MSPPVVGTVKLAHIQRDINALIYCNLISQLFVGDDTVRCLRTFIFPTVHCQHVFIEVFYGPVEQRRFQEIRIEFLTLGGRRVPFKVQEGTLKSGPLS